VSLGRLASRDKDTKMVPQIYIEIQPPVIEHPYKSNAYIKIDYQAIKLL